MIRAPSIKSLLSSRLVELRATAVIVRTIIKLETRDEISAYCEANCPKTWRWITKCYNMPSKLEACIHGSGELLLKIRHASKSKNFSRRNYVLLTLIQS